MARITSRIERQGYPESEWAAQDALGRQSHGKRGGVRVIYFWWMTDEKILLLDIYAKSAQENLASNEIEKLIRKVTQ